MAVEVIGVSGCVRARNYRATRRWQGERAVSSRLECRQACGRAGQHPCAVL